MKHSGIEKLTMSGLCGFAPRFVCGRRCLEGPEVYVPSAQLDLRDVHIWSFLIDPFRQMLMNSLPIADVVAVLRRGGRSQVSPAVIEWITVDVVDHGCRFEPRHPLPYDAVDGPVLVMQPDLNKKSVGLTAGFACIDFIYSPISPVVVSKVVYRAPLPAQLSSARVVIKALDKVALWWEIIRSHWSGPVRSVVRAAAALVTPRQSASCSGFVVGAQA